MMSVRNVYLAVYRLTPRQRAHFAIFIPNSDFEGQDLSTEFKSISCKGTIIQVVGEPLMAGYQLEIKRNYDCKGYRDLDKLVHLGHVDTINVFDPKDDKFLSDDSPRAPIERVASQIIPPQRGQNVRALIDGVNTRRCQEWTTEFISKLVELGIIGPEASDAVQSHRDSPTHGIFGQKQQ